MENAENTDWNDAIDAVVELLRVHPPHRIGEAAFARRLIGLKKDHEHKSNKKPSRDAT